MEDLDNYEAVARIVVIGVGGAGSNAVNRMLDEDIGSVEFYVCNTDRQALATSKAEHKLVLGEDLTEGLGAGGEPSVGKQAAEASVEEIRNIEKSINDLPKIKLSLDGEMPDETINNIEKINGSVTNDFVEKLQNFSSSLRSLGNNKIANSIDAIADSLKNISIHLDSLDISKINILKELSNISFDIDGLEDLATIFQFGGANITETINKISEVSGERHADLPAKVNATKVKDVVIKNSELLSEEKKQLDEQKKYEEQQEKLLDIHLKELEEKKKELEY